ncbi:MAG: PKD domain-containing protein [Marinilabilia sp.]
MIRTHTLLIFILLLPLLGGQLRGQEIEVRKLEINTPGNSEMAPVLKDSVLYFLSNRRTNILVTYLDQDEELLYRIFRAPLKPDGTFKKPKLFSPPGQPRFNAGPLTFSSNGATLIATHNLSDSYRRSKPPDNNNLLGLFSARKENKGWRQYEKLPLNIPEGYSAGHPSISEDGRFLFFVSDMDDGHGNTDIYVSRRLGGEWSDPENLGPQINTPGKELFPFIHPSGKLFFTSDGHEGPGEFCIYYTEWDTPETKPVPLPPPINSNSNDFSSFIADNEKWGYFASDRSGDDEIYEFRFPEIACSEPSEVKADNLCFTFFEDGPARTDTLPQIYRWDFGDGESATGLKVDHCFPGPGNYEVTLHVVDTLTNEELSSVASYDLELKPSRQIWFELPDTITTGEKIQMMAEFSGYEEVPENPVFFWDFDNGESRIGQNISYIYQEPGDYKVTCASVLDDGQEVCFFREITVIDPKQE